MGQAVETFYEVMRRPHVRQLLDEPDIAPEDLKSNREITSVYVCEAPVRRWSPDMCVGVRMRVQAVNGLSARCHAEGREELVDLALVGEVDPGTWVLVFLGAAREILDAQAAADITRALQGLRALMAGDGLGDAFSDLEARGPQLPPHLEQARRNGARIA